MVEHNIKDQSVSYARFRDFTWRFSDSEELSGRSLSHN